MLVCLEARIFLKAAYFVASYFKTLDLVPSAIDISVHHVLKSFDHHYLV